MSACPVVLPDEPVFVGVSGGRSSGMCAKLIADAAGSNSGNSTRFKPSGPQTVDRDGAGAQGAEAEARETWPAAQGWEGGHVVSPHALPKHLTRFLFRDILRVSRGGAWFGCNVSRSSR